MTTLIPEPVDGRDDTGPIVRLDTLDDERIDRLEAHLRAENATLHQRCNMLSGALVFNSNRLTDFERSLDQLRAQLAQQPCSLCRGDGCTLPTCRAAPAPAS